MYYFTSKIGTTSLQGIKLLKSLPAKVAEFEDAGLRVEKKVLRLYVSVAHSVGMDIGQGPEQLVHVHLREGVCVEGGGGGGGGGVVMMECVVEPPNNGFVHYSKVIVSLEVDGQ